MGWVGRIRMDFEFVLFEDGGEFWVLEEGEEVWVPAFGAVGRLFEKNVGL